MSILDNYYGEGKSIRDKITELEQENKRLQSALDYANRDREDMHNKIIELGNKRESQRNMNYKLRKENKSLKEDNDKLQTGPFKYSYIKKLKKQNEKLEEENKKLKDRIRELEQENKNLKLTLEQMENTCKDYLNDRDTLREENRKLKDEYDNFKKKVSDDMKEIAKNQLENIGLFDKLEEKIRFLEQCLDNKEKVNKGLREENKMLKEEIERLKS